MVSVSNISERPFMAHFYYRIFHYQFCLINTVSIFSYCLIVFERVFGMMVRRILLQLQIIVIKSIIETDGLFSLSYMDSFLLRILKSLELNPFYKQYSFVLFDLHKRFLRHFNISYEQLVISSNKMRQKRNLSVLWAFYIV